jgi:hypothetical protein
MSSTKIIDLEQTQELRDLNIVTDFFFEPDTTQNFILELNTVYKKPVRVIFHYYKDWTRTKRNAKETLIEKEIHKPHIKPILDTLDANYNNVTTTQENYNLDTTDDDDQDQPQNDSSKGENKKESSMEQSFKFVENHIQLLFKNQFGQLFAYVKINDNHYDVISLTSSKFEKYIYKIFYESEYKIILSKEERNEIIEHLQYKAEFSGITKKLELRVSKTDDYTFYYDLANKNEGIGAVKITPSGWSLENNPPILFIGYSNQLAQVNPSPSCLSTVDGIDNKIFDKFIDLLNVKGEDNKLLLKCYIISLFVPSIPKPILMLHGEQGSAKTTLQELIKMLVDPSIVRTLTFPRDINELVQQLSHNYLAYYENLSTIKEWISDALCRAVTGTGFSKRQLYTDDEDIIYFFLRCIGFNGINLAATKADLLDRGIIIQLERIPKKEKRKLPDIWNEFEILLPSLLSYIFDILVKVLQIKQKGGITFPNGLNRMADFEEYAEIISRCMGNPEGELQRVYQNNIGIQIDEAIAASPLSLAVVELMNSVKDDELWSGTATQLSEVLNDIAETKLKISIQKIPSWPKSPNYLSRRLNEVKTNLREKGIIIERHKDEKDNRLIKIRKVSSIPSYRLDYENQAQNDSKTVDNTKSIPSENKKENQAQKTDIRRYDDTDDTLHASVVELSRVSFNTQDLRHQKQTITTAIEESKPMSLREKIDAGLFTNHLISESDLTTQDYDYDPEIINNITRNHGSDRWYCMFKKCKVTGDKWLLMKHPCKKM